MNAIQTFENRIRRNRILNRAVRSTYIIWAKGYPAWEGALADRSFVQSEVMPIAQRFVNGEPGACTNELVAVWAAQLPQNQQRHGQWHAELLPVARDFLRILQGEFDYECQRSQRSLWYKLWYGAKSTSRQPVPVAVGS